MTQLGADVDYVWHSATDLMGFDGIILPGGFAHGDYLRPGALARFSPVMEAVARFASAGGPVLGICNGFQVLTEAGLLPGALQKNRGLRFVCATMTVRVESSDSVLTAGVPVGTELRIPINHFEGNYTCDTRTLAALRDEDRVVLRYVGNPNGSIDDIAGVCNRQRNVVGLMPHPERASDPLLGSVDGSTLLRALVASAGTSMASPAVATVA
jgi:phosphoribosylformylglycinamidine synthase